MIRSCIRQAVRVFAGTAFFLFALAANAGSITLSDTNCDSFSLAGSPGNQTLSCVVSNAPTGCSIQGPSTGTNTVAITLTAVCATGSPTTYAWSGGNCAGVTTQSCQAKDSNVTQNYSVVISNAVGLGTPNPATKQVVWSTAVAVKPSQCSILADVNPLPVGGGTVNLTASCTGGDPVATWTWSGPTTTITGNKATASITQSSAFGVTAANAGGSDTASLTVNVATGGGPLSCSGFLNTNVVTEDWPNWTQNTRGPMGPLDALIFKFTTGSTSSTNTGKFVLYSGSGQDSFHDVFISTTPCDFSTNIFPSTNKFTIGTSVSPSIPVLTNNTTYYINIRNSAGAVCVNPPIGTFVPCDLYMNLTRPAGL